MRRNKEQELLKKNIESNDIPTKIEIERTRAQIEKEYQVYLDLEKEALKRYYDNCPSELESDDEEIKSVASMGSYQTEETWTEEKYRRALLKFKRMEAYYPILQHTRDISVQRHPEDPTPYNKELFEARQQLDARQEKGKRLLEIAKMGANFQRNREELIKQTIDEEKEKWEKSAKEKYEKEKEK